MTRAQQRVALFLSLLLSIFLFLTSSPVPPNSGAPAKEIRANIGGSPVNQTIWVEVDGSVPNRGVWFVEKGQTVREVLEKAGGTQGNLSLPAEAIGARIDKNTRLHVLAEKEGQGKVLVQPLDPPTMKILSIPVNINTAGVEDLDILPGVGPKTAQAIVEFRETHGKFSTIEDLLRVKGVGPKKFASLRPHITIQD
jgi:competence protein ComEA